MQVTLESHLEEGEPLSKEQKKYVQMVEKCFKKYDLSLIDKKLYRYDSGKFSEHLELSDEEKELNESKLKSALKKKMRKLKFFFDNQIKIVIKTDIENVTQLVLTSYIPPSTIEVVENVFTLYYPKKLETGIIWGRYSKKERHGSGDLFFAPTNFDFFEFLKDKGENIISDEYIKTLANLEENSFLASTSHSLCNLISRIRHSKLIKEELDSYFEKFKDENMGNKLIDALNANKSLGKTFERFIVTFGNKTIRNKASFTSKIDVNLLAFNFKAGAIIQLSTFHSHINSAMKVLLEFISTLNDLTGKKWEN